MNRRLVIKKLSTIRTRKSARYLVWLIALSLATVTGAAQEPPKQELSKPGELLGLSVQPAIDQGVGFIYQDLRTPLSGPITDSYPLGIRALLAYALLESGVSAEAAPIGVLFDDMEKVPLKNVYSVSLAVMALDARARARGLAPAFESEQADEALSRQDEKARAKARRRIDRCLEWLVSARLRGKGVWGYERLGRARVSGSRRGPNALWVDFSNSQFVVLALQVGLRWGVEVPVKVWDEVTGAHREAAIDGSGASGVDCVGTGWWPEQEAAPSSLTANTAVGDTSITREGNRLGLRGIPMRWPYRPPWNLPPGARQPRSYSMVAAATSSLMVVRNGLYAQGDLTPERREEIDEMIVGGLLTLRSDWSRLMPNVGEHLWRNYYYTLYSFEKAMDLGGIQQLGEIDWYREHARLLIGQQKKSGAWGNGPRSGQDREYERVSTAFALLFLNRATRSLRVTPPAPIGTAGTPDAGEQGVSSGRVFLASQAGMIDLDELFGAFAAQRSAPLQRIVEEILQSVPPVEVPDLLPYLLRLRHERRDDVDRFARMRIELITGLDGLAEESAIRSWLETRRKLSQWGDEKALRRVPEIDAIVRGADQAGPLRRLAMETLTRLGSLESVPVLIETLSDKSEEIRRRSHRALELITHQRIPFMAEGSAEERAQGVSRWQSFWSESGEDLMRGRTWSRLRDALERAPSEDERARLRAEIVALGDWAEPRVREVLEGDRFAFDWILIHEQLTGSQTGI